MVRLSILLRLLRRGLALLIVGTAELGYAARIAIRQSEGANGGRSFKARSRAAV